MNKCVQILKRLQDNAPDYIKNKLIPKFRISSRSTRLSNLNLVCPRWLAITEKPKEIVHLLLQKQNYVTHSKKILRRVIALNISDEPTLNF